MSTALATLITRVKSRLEPETSAPTYSQIHDDQWARWSTSLAQKVVKTLIKEGSIDDLQALKVIDSSIVISSGSGTLPSGFLYALAVKATSSKYPCIIAGSQEEFALWDDSKIQRENPSIHDDVQRLRKIDQSITIASGIGDLPSDFYRPLSVKVTSAKVQCTLIDENEFAMWDSNNFVFTPTTNRPITTIANNKVYVKPTSLATPVYLDYVARHPIAMIGNGKLYIKPTDLATPAYLDYIKEHPDISGIQGTVFSAVADRMLEDLLFAQALEATEDVILGASE